MIDFNKKISNSNKFYSYIIPVSLQDACCQNWRFAGIYKITNKINGKCYVGQAVDIRKEPNSILRHVKEMSSQNYMTQYENME